MDESSQFLPSNLEQLAELLEEMKNEQLPLDGEALLVRNLSRLTTNQLRGIAKRRIWPLKGTRKDDLVAQMVTLFVDSLADDKRFAGLTRDEEALLAATNTLFGLYTALHEDHFNYVWKSLLKRKGTAVPVIKGLESYGILLRDDTFDPQGDIYYQILYPEYLPYLPVTPLITPKAESTPHHPLIPSFPAPDILSQIERFGYYLAAGGHINLTKINVTNARRLPPADRAQWMGEWPLDPQDAKKYKSLSYYRYMSDPPRVKIPLRPYILDEETFLAMQSSISNRDVLDWIAQGFLNLGILSLTDKEEDGDEKTKRLQFNPSMWAEFLAQTEMEKLLALTTLWANFWSDFYELRLYLREHPDLSVWRWAHPELHFEAFMIEFITMRQLVTRLLKGITTNKKECFAWYSLPRFFEELFDKFPDLYNYHFDWDNWGFERQGVMVRDMEEDEGYKQLRLEWITLQFTAPLYWLGMVELAVNHGRVQAFRLTPLGAYLLNPDQYPAPDSQNIEGTAEWQSDGTTIRVTPGTNLNSLLGLLLRITVPVQGETHTYRLGGSGLEQSFAQGESPASLMRQFSDLGYPLPPPAQDYLHNLYDRFGRVHLYEKMSVIEFTDDTAVAELRAANILKEEHITAALSPRLVVIADKYAETLYNLLEQKGYTPRMK